jgi:hypothetical protein
MNLAGNCEEGHSPFSNWRSSSARVGLVAIVGLYFTAVATYVAITALVNVNWNTETLSKLIIGLIVLVGAIGVGVVYVAVSFVIHADQRTPGYDP